ncbi:MAG TPA: HAD family phosphatase [Stackebrandtia sp.]|jgi:HAD superfamily hydrolase (TIGR01509 family)|uniref:HAD family hydrolase n=1 Tax=Stackebrandtia sp. TaxID=2023065 RepID=UPI002D5F1F75|nr:HAD family phosphatase [Stackebrandtia sp.]HZE39532.1 HAD family phosphatase [Stackebrandtia sp.]
MSEARLRAVLFDMDGTLLDSEKLWAVALRDLCARLGHELTPQLRADLVGMDQYESMVLLHSRLGLSPDGIADNTRWLVARVKALFAGGVVWRPGARELLEAVRAKGYRTALVTATGRELVDVILSGIGDDWFDVTIVGDEVARNKPDPEPYATAMRRLGLAPNECLAIEDSPTGVASATAAGCVVLAVPSEARLEPHPRVEIVGCLDGVDVDHLEKVHNKLL